MKPREDLKMHTLRHFLFYMGIATVVGAIVGAAAGTMNWSTGLVYAVGLPIALIVGTMAIRESLVAPSRRPNQQRHSHHA